MTQPEAAGPAHTEASVSGESAGSWSRPSAASPLLILAFDHRASLARDLYGLKRTPTPAEAARISADKMLVYQGLLDALDTLPPGVQPGVLFDEEYGAKVAAAAHIDDRVRLATPIEASGHDWFTFAYPDGWQAHAMKYHPDFVKVLVRDNPGLSPERRRGQTRRLAEVSAWAERNDRPLILELLVPATPEDTRAVEGNTDRYDGELRPRLTVRVITDLQDGGVEPAIWKVEGLETAPAAQEVAATARREGRTADLIVLGRNAPHDRLDHWLTIAAPVPGFVGFAIGRSIWLSALDAHLHHGAAGEDVRQAVKSTYLEHAWWYVHARDRLLA
jgi:5-dehydro-2-deoxygluconokinase